MIQTWHTMKRIVAALVTFVACPCHLPITLPLLIALTAGTALGTWLENNLITVAVISTITLIGGSILAFKWIRESNLLRHGSAEMTERSEENVSIRV